MGSPEAYLHIASWRAERKHRILIRRTECNYWEYDTTPLYYPKSLVHPSHIIDRGHTDLVRMSNEIETAYGIHVRRSGLTPYLDAVSLVLFASDMVQQSTPS